jgi:hypothetical protein
MRQALYADSLPIHSNPAAFPSLQVLIILSHHEDLGLTEQLQSFLGHYILSAPLSFLDRFVSVSQNGPGGGSTTPILAC